MTIINFATCDWTMAVRFLKQMNVVRNDAEARDVPHLKEMLEKDWIRIQDPNFYDPAQMTEGVNYKDRDQNKLEECFKVLTVLKERRDKEKRNERK